LWIKREAYILALSSMVNETKNEKKMKNLEKMESIHSGKFKKLEANKIDLLKNTYGGQHTCHCHSTATYVSSGFIFNKDDHYDYSTDHAPDGPNETA
jgi:hypothetical protein